MHAANPDCSRRLLRVLGVLADRREHSTRDALVVEVVNRFTGEIRQEPA